MLFFWLFAYQVLSATALSIATPFDGELVVTDALGITIVLGDGSPSPDRKLCLRLDESTPTCWSDYGPYGRKNVFATMIECAEGQHTLRAWIDDDSGAVVTSSFRTALPRKCDERSRRVFDVFPFFGRHELDILEMRTRVLRDVVDVFVPIEAKVTHSGLPKALDWASNGAAQPRFARDNIRGYVVDSMTIAGNETWAAATGDENLAREEKQRDAALDALRSLGALPNDLVIIADADEIASARIIDDLRRCENAAFPAILEMEWYMYNFNWRATRNKWGLFAREGAVVVTVAMLESRSATQWRRQYRDQRTRSPLLPMARLVKNAGWHLSSFGGRDAVAEKLRSYIGVSEYGNEFYLERLDRLLDAGVAYYELAGGGNMFECVDATRHELSNDTEFFASCRDTKKKRLDVNDDAIEAREVAAAQGQFVLGGFGDDSGTGKRRAFDASATCRRGEGVDRTQIRSQCAAAGLSSSACDQAVDALSKQCTNEMRATLVMMATDVDTIEVSLSISFEETRSIPISVDGATHHLRLSSTDNPDEIANRTCTTHQISFDQCLSLADSLRSMQPSKAWLNY